MKSIKNKIKNSFNRASATYDHYAQLQQKQSFLLVKQVGKFMQTHCNTIIDLGCGTGNSTLTLHDNFFYKRLYAIDIANVLLKKAKQKLKYRELYFVESDFDNLPRKIVDIDLIFSNMALQWSLDLNLTLALLTNKLSKHGILAFSLPLNGTFSEINSAYRNRFQFSPVIQAILKSLNLELLAVTQKTITEPFASPLKALRSLKMIGANCIVKNNQHHCFHREKLQTIVGSHVDLQKAFHLTYEIGFFIAKKRSIDG